MMSDPDKNTFGGGNRNSLYVPMSEVEQEALSRLVEAGDLRVHVVGWGVVNQPRISFGDAIMVLRCTLDFDRPAVPVDVYYFDLELRTGSGLLLFADRKSIEYGGKPQAIAAGVFIEMEWAIMIQSMDPRLVKALTGARGLTSRLQDRDTGDMTLTGNMKLDSRQKTEIIQLRKGEKYVRHVDGTRSEKSRKKQGS